MGTKTLELSQFKPNNYFLNSFSDFPLELVENILSYISIADDPQTRLVCRQWNILFNHLYKSTVKKLWPHLFEKNHNETDLWAGLYAKKINIERNIANGRFQISTFEVPDNYAPKVYNIDRKRIGLVRNAQDFVVTSPQFFQKQLDVIDIDTGHIVQTIEIKDKFCIRDSTIYIVDRENIKAYNIHNGKLLGSYDNFIKKFGENIRDVSVDEYNTMYIQTERATFVPEEIFPVWINRLYIWNLNTSTFQDYEFPDHKQFRIVKNYPDEFLVVVQERKNRLSSYFSLFNKDLKIPPKKVNFRDIPQYKELVVVRNDPLHKYLNIYKNDLEFPDSKQRNIVSFFFKKEIIILLVDLRDTYEFQYYDINSNSNLKNVPIDKSFPRLDLDLFLAGHEFFYIERVTEDHILIIGDCFEKQFLCLINLNDGTVIRKDGWFNLLKTPIPKENFNNQFLAWICSKSKENFKIKIINFDTHDETGIQTSIQPRYPLNVGALPATPKDIAFKTQILSNNKFKELSIDILNLVLKPFALCANIIKFGAYIVVAIIVMVIAGIAFIYRRARHAFTSPA